MNRRTFFRTVSAFPLLGPALAWARSRLTAVRTVRLQVSPLAGFSYYNGPMVWECLRPGDTLRLVREPGNRHDAKAVAIHWFEWKIGYLPRAENTAVAELLDRQVILHARVEALAESDDPWERVQLSVHLS